MLLPELPLDVLIAICAFVDRATLHHMSLSSRLLRDASVRFLFSRVQLVIDDAGANLSISRSFISIQKNRPELLRYVQHVTQIGPKWEQWLNVWASDLQLMPHITSYTLRGYSQWTLKKSVLEYALDALPRAQLRTLELNTTWIDDNALRALCETTLPALRTLRLLNVRRYSLWRDLGVALKRLLPCGVEVLYISAMDSSRVSGMNEDVWERSADSLTSLTLRGLSWPHNDLSCTLFRHAPRLRHLSLDVEPYHSNLYDSETYDFSKILELELRGSGIALAQWLHRAKNATKITLELMPTDSESLQDSGSRFKRQLVGEVRFPALRELRTTNITFTPKEIGRLRRVIAHPLLTLVVDGVKVSDDVHYLRLPPKDLET